MNKKWSQFKNNIYTIQVIVAVCIILLSLPCLLNFSSMHNTGSIFNLWEPMKFNTSLAFFTIGFMFASSLFLPVKIIRILSTVVFLLGFITLAQYLSGLNFGIDQLFLRDNNSLIDHPGRMSISSCICFILCGIIISLQTLPQIKMEKYSIISCVLSMVLAGIVAVPLLSYAFATTGILKAGLFSNIAFPTALTFLIIGGFLSLKSLALLKDVKGLENPINPFFFAVILFLGFLTIWQVLLKEEQKNFQRLVNQEAISIRNELQEKIKETSNAVKRFADRESFLGTKDKKFLAHDARSYLEQIKIINRIGLIDKNYKVIWSYPQDLDYQVKSFNQASNPARKIALEMALAIRGPIISSVIDLKSGGKGFIIPVPLTHKNDEAAFLYATLDAKKLFSQLKSVDVRNINLAVYENDQELYRTTEHRHAINTMSSSLNFQMDNSYWKINVTPSEEFLVKNHSTAPYIILIAGAMFSFVIGAFLQSIYKARRREAVLAQNEKMLTDQLNIALSASQMAVWSLDLETEHVWRSENHDKIFGYKSPVENWSKEIFIEHILEEDRHLFEASIKSSLTEEATVARRVDLRIKRANDQSIRWIKTICQLQSGAQGSSKKLVGIVRDITDEKNAEKKSIIDAEWIRAILNSTEYSIIATDENGIIQTFNTAAEKMLGYSKSELINIATPEVFHDKDEVYNRAVSLSRELGQQIVPGFSVFTVKSQKYGLVDTQEWTYIRKDGSRFPISLAASALRDPTGKVVGFLGIGIDLSQEKKNKEQLRIAHQRLERIIEATEEGIWERDFKTKEITFIDKQAKKIFGVDDDANLHYEMMLDLIHPDDKVTLAECLNIHVLHQTPNFNVEFRVLNPKFPDAFKWVRARGKVESADNESPRLVSTVSDVTLEVQRRKQLEEALKAASEATLVKSAFLASMSHEIRTPLNGIIGMTDLLLETALNEDQKRFAEIVQNSGVGLLDLVNDILDFSKIESGKLDLENSEFSLPNLIENQIDLLVARARKKSISLVTYISPDLPQNFIGDAGRLGQIILNVVSNAIKFTENGGVSLRVYPLLDSEAKLNFCKIRLEVRDTGIGISPENQLKLFQPFSQADNKISRKFGGTGLGLSISKELIIAMGGSIGVESTEGNGSTFWIELPLACNNTSTFFTQHSQIKNLHDMRVLIFDSDSLVVETVNNYLSSWKMRGVSANNINHLLELIQAGESASDPFSVVFIGLNANTEECFKLSSKIAENFPNSNLQLIALTEFEWNSREDEILKHGFFEVLKKPLKQSPLFDSIARSWSGEKKIVRDIDSIKSFEKNKDKRILVVDDVKTNRMLAVSLLEKMGYNTHVVSSGKEALETLQQMTFDLILMDCMMSEMDGLEATRQIRKLTSSIKDIPIVAMTANVNVIDKQECMAAGMNDFIPKPLFKENVKMVLNKILESSLTPINIGQTKLLLVDDNEENRTLILHYLKALPYSIEVAVDGLDAFEKFKAGDFAIVLMDVQMPIMDGYESTKSIRAWEKENGRAPKTIIALTANALKEQCEKAIESGCNDYLTKPIRKQKLVDYLESIGNKKAA